MGGAGPQDAHQPILVELHALGVEVDQHGQLSVSAASAVRWCVMARERGSAAPRPQGGDRRSQALEASAALIDTLLAETPEQTLMELRDRLATCGVRTTHTCEAAQSRV